MRWTVRPSDLKALTGLFETKGPAPTEISGPSTPPRRGGRVRSEPRWLGREGVLLPQRSSPLSGVGRSTRRLADEIAGDPKNGDKPITYAKVDGPAFVNGASYYDVDQGQLGDCWLVAGMAAVAHMDPKSLEKMIEPLGTDAQGKDWFKVELKVRLPDGQWSVHEEKVSNNFPTFSADPTPNKKAELWVALIEKAYAQWKGDDYDALNGGKASLAMESITGKPSKRWSVDDSTSPQALLDYLKSELAEGHAICLATKNKGEPIHSKLANWHYYVVISVKGEEIELYNPWGPNDSGKNKPFTLPAIAVRDSIKLADVNLC